MAQGTGFFTREKRKKKKELLEKKARELTYKQSFVLPKIEIIKKGKNDQK